LDPPISVSLRIPDLDLRRFPGNPAMVEELHHRLLSGLDTLELTLRRVRT